MSIRLSRSAKCVLVVAAFLVMSGRTWAVFYALGPSKDEWGLQYDVEFDAGGGETLNATFTLVSEGRLKPVYSFTVVAFSDPDSTGGRAYLVKAPIELKATDDGKRVGRVQIRKEFVDRAMIRVLTLTVDGRRQTSGAAYYDIPLKKFLNKAPAAASLPAPPASEARK